MSDRFVDSPDWRFVLTDLAYRTVSSLTPYATGQTVTRTLGQPLVVTGEIDSDLSRVNLTWTADGNNYPYLWEGVRFLFGFRREQTAYPWWTVRASTLVLNVEPAADGDWGVARYTGYDPRQLLMKRPWVDDAGLYPGPQGTVITSASADEIIQSALANGETYHGNDYILVDTDYITPTATIDEFTIQQGMMIGELFEALEATGTVDIYLDPIFDPTEALGAGPNIVRLRIEEPTVYDPSLFITWDRAGRSADGLSNTLDGTQRENRVRLHYGQGGDAVALQEDTISQGRYGVYFGELFLPGLTAEAATEVVSARRLALLRNGHQTFTARLAPDRSKRPFLDYDIGRYAQFGTSRDLLRATDGTNVLPQKIESIPVSIDDLGVETVAALVVREPEAVLD